MSKNQWIPATLALVSSLLSAVWAASQPRQAPDYTINLGGEKTLTLAQYKGKAVVLAFILTYCEHCQKTVGFLIQDQNEYGPRGLQVVASAIEPAAAQALPNFLKDFKPTFPLGSSTGESAIAFMQHPAAKVPLMPMLAFIDSQGMIRAQYEGDDKKFFGEQQEQNLHREIEALLKGMPRPKK